jgi:hypothetical protein
VTIPANPRVSNRDDPDGPITVKSKPAWTMPVGRVTSSEVFELDTLGG